MLRYEKTTEGSNKFWTIEIANGDETVVTYGAIGAKPRESHKSHASEEAAKKFVDKMIAQKRREHYVEVGAPPAAPEGAPDEGEEPASKRPKTDSEFERYEMTTGGHNKFWQIKVSGCRTVVEYGAIGAAARTSEKVHGDEANAVKFKLSMVGKKKKEGYVLRSGGGDPPAAKTSGEGSPRLHVWGSAVNATELEKRRDDWSSPDEEDVCDPAVLHGTMEEAPEAAKEVATALHEAMPRLEETYVVPSSESSDGGEVVVVSSPGADVKLACLKALGIRESLLEAASKSASVKSADWSKSRYGFNRDPDDDPEIGEDDDEESRADFAAVLKGTKIMAERLEQHFELNFRPDWSVAPVLYGGRAKDGSIVGILSSRVWT
uniref:WGR domain-containing protein n=1 Tax=Alexandrium monilatum TaxID=311494 RepID=A0A7S4RVG0_9DINO